MFVTFISPYTPVGKNLGMHLKLVNVDGHDDFFNKDNNDNNNMNVIYSSSDKLLEKTHKNFNSAPLWQKITGIGFVENYGTPQQNVKTIEMDFQDIFYRFGVLGFFIYLSLPMIILYNCFKKVIVKFKNCFFNTDIISYIIAILLGLSIAALAGHVLTAPAVSIYLVYIIIMLDRELNKMED